MRDLGPAFAFGRSWIRSPTSSWWPPAADAGADGIFTWTLWAAIVSCARENPVWGYANISPRLRVSVPVTKLAKWKTTVQLVAIGFLLAGEAGDQVIPITTRPACCCCGSPRFSPSIRLGLFRADIITSSRRMRMKVKYFAWVRERVGKSEETVERGKCSTVDDLIRWLAGPGGHTPRLRDARVIRAAIDQPTSNRIP